MRPHHRVLETTLAVALVASLAIAPAVAAQDVPSARIGSCSAYSGLPGEAEADGMTFVPAGTFSMGSNRHRPEERYTHIVRVDGFWIDRTEVTNAQFAKFISATGYITLAERGGDAKLHANMPKELLAPGSVAFIMPTDVSRGGSVTQWFQ
jgi:sulfatase modifying factor 1